MRKKRLPSHQKDAPCINCPILGVNSRTEGVLWAVHPGLAAQSR
jgi:hypothetical protein